jgi:ribonuclease HI
MSGIQFRLPIVGATDSPSNTNDNESASRIKNAFTTSILRTSSDGDKSQGSAQTLTVFADGLCEPNPNGKGCWGWVAFDSEGKRVACGWGFAGSGAGMTNNVAEFTAIIEALRWIITTAPGTQVELLSDSQVAVRQILGEYSCHKAHLQELRDEALSLIARADVTLRWIPREQNAEADALSQKAYREASRRATV